jgi:hypothetical protein
MESRSHHHARTTFSTAKPADLTVDFPSLLAIVIPVASFLLAAFSGRWRVLHVPVYAWLLFFLGVEAGFWSYPFGDTWLLAFLFSTAVGVAAVSLGISLRWLLLRRKDARAKNTPERA